MLDESPDLNAQPAKGRLGKKVLERESTEEFTAARKRHPAVESAIHQLECDGLDRVRTHGAAGFARTVVLSILAANIHRLGKALLARDHRCERRKLRPLSSKGPDVRPTPHPFQPERFAPRGMGLAPSRKAPQDAS